MPTYYYADQNQNTVGPVSLDVLQSLRASGVVAEGTPVIEEGAGSWRRYADVVVAHDPSPAGPYTPPPPPPQASREDAVRARVASAAARTSAAAEATASVIQHSVLQTFRAAGTGAEKAVVFASTAGVVAFFLPWFGGFGGSASGFAMAQQVSGLLWVLPLSFGTCFFLSYLNIKAAPRQRALRARWFLFLGSFWVAVVLLATVAGRSLFGIAAIGLYLTLVSTAAIAVGGFMQIGETLGDM